MIEGLVALVIYLCVLGLVAWLLLYIVSVLPLPEPFGKVARVVIIVVCCLILIVLLLQLVGVNVPLRGRLG